MDVRKDTEGRDLLRKKFRVLEVILDDPKFERILARK
jgi:hypothetical protein